MWRSDLPAALMGCGVDAERIDRFDKFSRGKKAWPFVFSKSEVDHILSLPGPSEAFCASFCCKEAVLKAIQEPFHFPDCELFFEPGAPVQPLRLAGGLRRKYALQGALARFDRPVPGELLAVVYLLAEQAG